jgi:N6-adenosine-specific RNA methylase IME4
MTENQLDDVVGQQDNKRRSSRRKTTSRYGTTTVPSAVHYVGYVEDDETPEMIMSKFQELEEIQRQASVKQQGNEDAQGEAVGEGQQQQHQEGQPHQEDGLLTDDQLLQVFKQTSMFNVKTALNNNAMLAGIDDVLELTNERYGDDDIISDDEDMLRSFWSDDDDWEDGHASRRKKKGSQKQKGVRQRSVAAPKVRHRVVTAYNPSTQALVRKKVKVADPNEIQYIRLPPPPLPLSWGRTIAPYSPQKQDAAAMIDLTESPCGVATHVSLPRIENSVTVGMLPERVAEAVLVNSAWYRGYDADESMRRISSVAFEKLAPYGFIFVWTPKELVHSVCKLMQSKGYAYIENLTWVWMQPNNKIAEIDSEYVRRSHVTLYMFRAVERLQNIELRHQRSPDVIFDYQKDGHKCPRETYMYIETLLPQSKGKLVEIWGNPQENDRQGWTVIHTPSRSS